MKQGTGDYNTTGTGVTGTGGHHHHHHHHGAEAAALGGAAGAGLGERIVLMWSYFQSCAVLPPVATWLFWSL